MPTRGWKVYRERVCCKVEMPAGMYWLCCLFLGQQDAMCVLVRGVRAEMMQIVVPAGMSLPSVVKSASWVQAVHIVVSIIGVVRFASLVQ